MDLTVASLRDGECTTEVFQPLGASKSGLMLGLAGPSQCLESGEAGEGRELAGNFLGLVEMTVLEALTVKWHGDERPFSGERRSEPWIGKRVGGESPEIAREVEFSAVFQTVDHVERAGIPEGGGAGKFKRKFQFVAVWAGEYGVDLALEALAASLAKRFCEARQVCRAAVAQCSTVGEDFVAHGTKRWVEQVQRAAEPPFENLIGTRALHGGKLPAR